MLAYFSFQVSYVQGFCLHKMISPSRDDAMSCFLWFGYVGIWGNAGHRTGRELRKVTAEG